MDCGDRLEDDCRRIAKRIAELEKMLRSLQGAKRSPKRVHNVGLSSEVSAVAGMLWPEREDSIGER
jgi:hypothetical protein